MQVHVRPDRAQTRLIRISNRPIIIVILAKIRAIWVKSETRRIQRSHCTLPIPLRIFYLWFEEPI